jgi:protein-L-isoaspartate(D-aspartate) O-methyltransferase
MVLAGSVPGAEPVDLHTELRRRMVEEQLRGRGIHDEKVLAAMEIVPRHRFVAPEREAEAYQDRPLPIGYGQSIYQPYVVALMTSLLEVAPGDRVLEIGTGSGYHTAVLSRMAARVYTIEIIGELGRQAERTLRALGIDNVEARVGDGYQGWPEAAPFDAILLTAAPPHIPEPLLEQLAVGGVMVAPVGGFFQNLKVITKRSKRPGDLEIREVGPVRVAPMTGEGLKTGPWGGEERRPQADGRSAFGETRGKPLTPGRGGGDAGFWNSLLSRAAALLGGGDHGGSRKDPYQPERNRMVREQIEARGIADRRVLEAMRTVPRHHFVPLDHRDAAYTDQPLPIGFQQTISQPYIVALMSSLLQLKPRDRVLEIGTGSGYHAAVLSRLVDEVYTIEIIEELSRRAEQTLDELDYRNVRVRAGDGYRGWPEAAPFDGIVLTAAPPRVPEPLVQQLKVGGRMVIPLGDRLQQLQVLTRTADGVRVENVIPVRFVPMTGEVQRGGSR